MNNQNLSLEFSHFPVMLKEVIRVSSPSTSKKFIDCTFGGGGYSKEILKFSNTNVQALDRDKKAIPVAKELEKKMKESQQKIKEIRAEGISGSNSIKITLDGEGEMQRIQISDEVLKEEKTIIEDLIVAAHNNAKSKLKSKTNEEISKATGNFGIPGFKWPL